jgi:hypothetical protein
VTAPPPKAVTSSVHPAPPSVAERLPAVATTPVEATVVPAPPVPAPVTESPTEPAAAAPEATPPAPADPAQGSEDGKTEAPASTVGEGVTEAKPPSGTAGAPSGSETVVVTVGSAPETAPAEAAPPAEPPPPPPPAEPVEETPPPSGESTPPTP